MKPAFIKTEDDVKTFLDEAFDDMPKRKVAAKRKSHKVDHEDVIEKTALALAQTLSWAVFMKDGEFVATERTRHYASNLIANMRDRGVVVRLGGQ